MPLDGSGFLDLPRAPRAAPPPRRLLGLAGKEWGGFLLAFGLVLALAGALALATLRVFGD